MIHFCYTKVEEMSQTPFFSEFCGTEESGSNPLAHACINGGSIEFDGVSAVFLFCRSLRVWGKKQVWLAH